MRAEKNNKVIAIVGATASGKTAYSIELAKKINGEIISADSRLVYKGFDIGTAKPTVEEREGIPHYLVDVVEPEQEYSAGLWAKEAEKYIEDILVRGKTPIIVGGTGLYFRILLENYNLPNVLPNPVLRDKLSKLPFDELLKRFRNFDADTHIELNDKKKLIRYVEIVETTKLPLSEVRGVKDFDKYEVEWIGCNFPRDTLYERINQRVDMMLDAGLIEETQVLLKKHGRIPNLVDTIGYHEIIEYLDGKTELKTALDTLKQNTRHYAKRQLTWFRRNTKIKWNIYPDTLPK